MHLLGKLAASRQRRLLPGGVLLSYFFCAPASAGFFGGGDSSKPNLKYDYVTCGSMIKLLNTYHQRRLHSHEVKYGSGSGQQSVTGVDTATSAGSYWRIAGPHEEECVRGQPARCGDTLRLIHTETNKNLHSHLFSSPLSSNQEISAYGNDGLGDTGDNWELVCSTTRWRRDGDVSLRHVDTGRFLAMTGNQFGRPISGHREVVGMSQGSEASWRVEEGLYVLPKQASPNDASDHDEL